MKALKKMPVVVVLVVIGLVILALRYFSRYASGSSTSTSKAGIAGNGVVTNAVALSQPPPPPPPPKQVTTSGVDAINKTLKENRLAREEDYLKSVLTDFASFNYIGFADKVLNAGDYIGAGVDNENEKAMLLQAIANGDAFARLTFSLKYPEEAKQLGIFAMRERPTTHISKGKLGSAGGVTYVGEFINPRYDPAYAVPTTGTGGTSTVARQNS